MIGDRLRLMIQMWCLSAIVVVVIFYQFIPDLSWILVHIALVLAVAGLWK